MDSFLLCNILISISQQCLFVAKIDIFHSWVHVSLLKIVEINEIKLMKLNVLHNLCCL